MVSRMPARTPLVRAPERRGIRVSFLAYFPVLLGLSTVVGGPLWLLLTLETGVLSELSPEAAAMYLVLLAALAAAGVSFSFVGALLVNARRPKA